MDKKKAWLDNLYYTIGKQQYDFFLCGTYEKNDETHFTKWKKYSECIFPIDFDGTADDWKTQQFFNQINQRQILPIEVVLDIEEKKQIRPILKKLREWGWEYSVWETGSRGYHIRIITNEEFTEKEKMAVLKQLGTDEQKAGVKTMIALENVPHWKSGKIKTDVTGQWLIQKKKS